MERHRYMVNLYAKDFMCQVCQYALIFKHLCESNLPISKIRSIFASYIGKIFEI